MLYRSSIYFQLQSEYHIFVEEFKRNPGQTWIMKPVAKSQGKGIFLFRKLKDITDWKKVTFKPLRFVSITVVHAL